MEEDEEAYRIRDWVPPWIDNGERLLGLVNSLREYKDYDAWKIMSLLLMYQLEEDIARLKYLSQELMEIERNFKDGSEGYYE